MYDLLFKSALNNGGNTLFQVHKYVLITMYASGFFPWLFVSEEL